jgi:CRP-like cAMP-binding protein
MARKPTPVFDSQAFLAIVGSGITSLKTKKHQIIFSQGDASDAVFYIREGKVKLSVRSERGKEAVVAVLGRRAFFGEACLTAQMFRIATATSTGPSTVVRIEKSAMIRVLHEEPGFSDLFLSYLLSRNVRVEADLVDQLFNSSEKRLARILLLLAHFGKENKTEAIIPKISQETLAKMIGTPRSRVSFFMTKFRKLGFVSNNSGLRVHSSLLNVVLHD